MSTTIFKITVECLLNSVGDDVGGESEVKTNAWIGSGAFSAGPIDLPINQKLNPPKKLIECVGVLQGSEVIVIKIIEDDAWPNPDDTIIAWRWRPVELNSLKVGQSTGKLTFNFGVGQANPTGESGFEGVVHVTGLRLQ